MDDLKKICSSIENLLAELARILEESLHEKI